MYSCSPSPDGVVEAQMAAAAEFLRDAEVSQIALAWPME
jgi:hypothetical protein